MDPYILAFGHNDNTKHLLSSPTQPHDLQEWIHTLSIIRKQTKKDANAI